jgi:hypothetical protein
MNITETLALLNALKADAKNKRETKVYMCFIRIVTALKNRDLTVEQSRLIQEKLTSLNLTTAPENKKKYYKLKLTDFVAFLKNEFQFTSEKYYTEIWMIFGMSIGTGLGLIIGIAFDPALGSSIGLCMGSSVGMIFGMLYGAQKDTEAKKSGLVI